MLAEATALVLAAGATLYVAQPLFSSHPPHTSTAGDESLEDHKLELYESFRDLEYDRQMQKISTDDYVQLRQQLTHEVLTVLSQLDEKTGPAEGAGTDPLEEEIARYRIKRSIRDATCDSIFCPRCHHAQPKENRFCGQCGTRLESTAAEDNHAR